MICDKKLIERVIMIRLEKNDPVKEFATRNKASPDFGKFRPYSKEKFNNIFYSPIDGIKLKFRYTTFFVNARF